MQAYYCMGIVLLQAVSTLQLSPQATFLPVGDYFYGPFLKETTLHTPVTVS